MGKPCAVTFKEDAAINPSLYSYPLRAPLVIPAQCHKMPGLRVGQMETPGSKKEEQTCQSLCIKQRGEIGLETQISHFLSQYLFLYPIITLKRNTASTLTLSSRPPDLCSGTCLWAGKESPPIATSLPVIHVSVDIHQ